MHNAPADKPPLARATALNLGEIGVHYVEQELTPEVATDLARMGYTAVWIAGTRDPALPVVERVLAATETLVVATGVVNIWHMEAQAVADTYHRLEAAYPGRFLLGSASGIASSAPTSGRHSGR